MKSTEINAIRDNDVAIVGISGRFPGAKSIDAFWKIIRDGKETITFYSRNELLDKGIDPAVLDNPAYVPADAIIESADKFDSAFFGYTPREADFMDPQQRVFLEECYSALENSGYDPDRYKGEIGVFAGCSRNNYWLKNLSQHQDVLNSLGELQTIVNNDKDFLTTRVSYKLNLKGPSVDIQTACSTSLVAIHFACQSLITRQCDMTLAGGVFIKTPRNEGYLSEDGNIDSLSGHCRPFDNEADGTIFGEGVGVVVLKRLKDAIADRDTIVAVIKSTAINNDGSQKVGFMAPGVSGQLKVIAKAMELADTDPETISYLETHGTGTKLGDPIEIEALRRVYSTQTEKKQFCALGSVKANIGHLDAAAGVTSLIKAALVLKNRLIPPLANFKSENPALDLGNSPFYINTELKEWKNGREPRRAALSSFGIGGTNSHAVLEEWIPDISTPSLKKFHLLPLSAKSDPSLKKMHQNLLEYLGTTDSDIADIAFTLQNGRKEFRNRGILICDNSDIKVQSSSGLKYFTGNQKLFNPSTVFMFTGQGSQYLNMAKGLYDNFDSVKTIMDYADTLLKEHHNLNLLQIIFSDSDENREILNQTSVAQPALFVVQFAIANLLMEFGILPEALTGHSIGEITAACLSGLFAFEDALDIVAYRGKFMQQQAQGSMLSVNLPADQIRPLIDNEVEISLVNAPNFCVVSGTFKEIDNFEKRLLSSYPGCRATRLKTSHAFHSRLMEPAIEPFLKILEKTAFGSINIPFISNVTGTWITEEEAVKPQYWASHIRSTVKFSEGISELIKDENRLFIEIGPGNSLSTLISQFPAKADLITLSTVRHPKQSTNDVDFFLKSFADFWLRGGKVNWDSFYAEEKRFRVPLPSYPFERTRHWIEPKTKTGFYASPGNVTLSAANIENEVTTGVISSEPTDLFHRRPSLDNEYVAPESGVQKTIAAIWADLLGIREIGINDNFFHLGGHSLLASQTINRINEVFRSGLTIDKFFDYPTIKGLTENEFVREVTVGSVPENIKTDYTSPLPLSGSQKRLWIVNKIDNNTPAYNISFTYLFEGLLEKEIFRKSLGELFDRHPVLKSCFRSDSDNIVVIINDNIAVNVEEVDFSKYSEAESDNEIQKFIESASIKTFDIDNGPLYRIYLLVTGKEKLIVHFTIHHLIFDGWSWGIFVKELKEIYNSHVSGKKPDLEPIVFDYFEYARLEEKMYKKENYKLLKEYWSNKLRGISGQLNFPLDFKRKEIPTGRGGRIAFNIGKERAEKVMQFSRKENVTLYMYFLSVFGFLLSRYSGDKDLCIGSPTANRPDSRFENLIGLFINSIVLRLKIDEHLTFADFLKSVRSISLEALTNQYLPFEEVVDLLQPDRFLNMNPLFQFMFAWQNAPRPPLDLKGVRQERVFQKNGVSPLDLTFYAWEENGSVTGEIEYSSDIFKRSTIEAFKENFLWLLDIVIRDPGIPLSRISIISEQEEMRIINFNTTDALIPDLLLHELFEQRVNDYSDKNAVVIVPNGVGVSYAEMEKRSNQLAHWLNLNNFRSGSIAGISMSRTESMIIAVLGVLKAGGTYLPLDPVFPGERLSYILDDSGAEFLITEKVYAGRFDNKKLKIIVYDEEQTFIRKEKTTPFKSDIDKNSIAYILYTSGSTGNPKGVRVHHNAVVNFINSMSKLPGLSADDNLLAVTTLSFDISILELFLPLSQGSTIYLADNQVVADGVGLSRLIDDFEISVLQATPTTWKILLETGWTGNKNLKALCGGEALQPALARDLSGKVASLWNMYGPTETTVWSSCDLITDPSRILVGRPIDNTQFHILNNDQEQPVGAIGELCIGGAGVAKGYHNRKDLTNEKFISWRNRVLYRTGDLARFLDNGKIELLGRNDNQIKLRGYRIEPGEIEFRLCEIAGVIAAVAKPEKFSDNDIRLVGYLHVSDSFSLTREQIVRLIENRLPSYMIPSAFVLMKEFPRTLNGKIDRKALVFNASQFPEEEAEQIGYWTVAEKSMAVILKDILKINKIKKNAGFFDAGGNSLLAISAINRFREELGFNLTFREFLLNSTISQLSSLLENQSGTGSSVIELEHLSENDRLPLTMNQKRLWIISRLQPEVPLYIIQYSYLLTGKLDRDIFNKSLNLLLERHKVLFAVFNETEGHPYCTLKHSKANISFFDYSDLPENERNRSTVELIDEDTRNPFDLQEGPLHRVYLIKTGAEEHCFHLSIHHIVFDGWSWSVFVKDLKSIYNSLLKGEETKLESLEFQQYDYARWENTRESLKMESEMARFWKEYLKGASPMLNFPFDFPRKDQPSGKGSFVAIELPYDLSEQIRRISREENASLFSTLMAAYGIQLYKYSGEDDINIGMPVAYRPHSKLENIFGMFVNTVVVRLRQIKESSFRKVIRLTNDAALSAVAHQEMSFENIVEVVNPERSSNANPIFQVAFVWQKNLDPSLEMDGISSHRISGNRRTTPFDITLYLWEKDGRIEGEIEYSTDLLTHETVLRFRTNFLNLVGRLIENPDTPADSLSLISEEERRKILDFNRTRRDYPRDRTISQLFEEQVSLFHDKPAVVFKGRTLSYNELNERSNQLAGTLRNAGVKNNEPVGLLADKSLDLIIGILAILKAGGGYVPIDPDYPGERINFIIGDSGCKILLTQDKCFFLSVEGVTKINLNTESSYSDINTNPAHTNSSSSLAYIMYTSGTTGRPKGSMIPQHGVTRLIRNIDYMELTSEDRILLTGAIVFDATTFEIWGALLNGGTLYVVEKETILDAKALGGELDRNNITILWLTSALFTQIAEAKPEIFNKLKYLLTGGDVISAPHINRVRKINPGLKVLNCYGPTENSTFSTTYLIEKDFNFNIPVGKPISNSTTYIFDRNMNYQPIGIIGDLYVGGDGLSLGYINREDLNKISFIEHPFIPGERIYRTGDNARWLPDGNIEFHGRVDNQLKIRGFRVELEEIESVISEIEEVIETVVKPVKIQEGDKRLVAFLNITENFSMDIRKLKRRIREKLPPYMVPSAFKLMHGFPKTINGKTDKDALKIDLRDLFSTEKQSVKNLNPYEKVIFEIWSEALKTTDLSLQDNFFDAGGNSLLAISVFSKIESAFKIDLGLRVFFGSPRIRDLAEIIEFTVQNAKAKIQTDNAEKADLKIFRGEL